MQHPATKTAYRQRKLIVEPVFGQIKNAGFRGFSVLGKEKSPVNFP
jgi:transposase